MAVSVVSQWWLGHVAAQVRRGSERLVPERLSRRGIRARHHRWVVRLERHRAERIEAR